LFLKNSINNEDKEKLESLKKFELGCPIKPLCLLLAVTPINDTTLP